jgi:hypothetical protein
LEEKNLLQFVPGLMYFSSYEVLADRTGVGLDGVRNEMSEGNGYGT